MAQILIVASTEALAEMAATILIDAGHVCAWLSDIDRAVTLLQWRRVDLMVVDHHLPSSIRENLHCKLRVSAVNFDVPVLGFAAIPWGENGSFAARSIDPVRLRSDVALFLKAHSRSTRVKARG